MAVASIVDEFSVQGLAIQSAVVAGALAPCDTDPIDTICRLQNEIEQLTQELHQLRKNGQLLHGQVHRFDEELRLAARLQQDFLPKTLPSVGPVRFHALFRPAGHVSGDFYDVIRLDETTLGFYIADAVGHGMPAALLTMFIKHALVTKQITGDGYRLLSAGETMARLNQSFLEQGLSAATFATALYGTINTQTRRLTFSRGGHPHPLLLGANGQFDSLEVDGGLLGIFPDETFEQYSIDLVPGDRLLLYTDGIELIFDDDQHTGSGIESQRWHVELRDRRHLPVQQLLSEFAALVDRECDGLEPKDDLTILAVEIE